MMLRSFRAAGLVKNIAVRSLQIVNVTSPSFTNRPALRLISIPALYFKEQVMKGSSSRKSNQLA